jgi:hypothetical protein
MIQDLDPRLVREEAIRQSKSLLEDREYLAELGDLAERYC